MLNDTSVALADVNVDLGLGDVDETDVGSFKPDCGHKSGFR